MLLPCNVVFFLYIQLGATSLAATWHFFFPNMVVKKCMFYILINHFYCFLFMSMVITFIVVFMIFSEMDRNSSWSPVYSAGIPGIPGFRWIPRIPAGICGGVKSTDPMIFSFWSLLELNFKCAW